ncbi:MAG: efflux RND transporter periplasmic adaptor subunit [Algibacter sp.]|uniref:efflux RND transporter periplasmic adaptor subunit n=1 Tax=Algibacter sp. TaxID=1872428 RepID=UPI0026378C3B|nr:efflux RND transporter periplasmic adaptor subunit [Algibacter sp.]MDG1729444.1 efflux RND transporter periplasmic adaptor subunit [Algibacter sp.]MDG2178630.1 efflux RND transporter periplasmic adaptor subunit [Algibacter sp.]
MKKSTRIIIALIAIALIGYFIIKPKLNSKKLDYTYTIIEKGNIEADISSTGTVEAINTVEVGTQISGTIKKIYVDYNDNVKAGQLLAEMDLKLLNASLSSAQANLAVSQAQLNQAKDTYDRNTILFEKGVISEQEYLNSKYTYNQIESAKKAALAAVQNTKVNIGFAHITSPISGTITERSVEEGQTVAASFATPTMFIIAEDLSKMQILADVDESDIGYIKDGMQVRFKVQTYPEKEFYGTVSQIRLQPIEINNVVNYQVVVDVDNKKELLLPGMTANLEFITDTAKNVLLINNSALRFRPNEAMLKEIKPVLEEKANNMLPDSLKQKFNTAINNEETYTPVSFKKNLPSNIDGFFFKNESGKLDFKFIEIGVKTGLQSEIKRFLDGSELAESMKVINGIKSKN